MLKCVGEPIILFHFFEGVLVFDIIIELFST